MKLDRAIKNIIVDKTEPSISSLHTRGTSHFDIDLRVRHTLPRFPKEYYAYGEYTDMIGQVSMDFREHFDYLGNRASVFITRNGETHQIIAKYSTGEVVDLTLDDSTCRVSNMSDTVIDDTLPGFTITDGHFHIVSPSSSVLFGGQYGEVYKGITTVRGLSVDHWSSCQYREGSKTSKTIEVHHYFSRPGELNISIPNNQKLLRMEVIGNDNTNNTHSIRDFFSWNPNAFGESPEVFQLICSTIKYQHTGNTNSIRHDNQMYNQQGIHKKMIPT
ncbi:hypothetical protein ScPMuIL_005725 [Solemya velum]